MKKSEILAKTGKAIININKPNVNRIILSLSDIINSQKIQGPTNLSCGKQATKGR